MKINFKLLGMMLVLLVSLESCSEGCAVDAGADSRTGCLAGQTKINGSCTGATPYTCPTDQINIDDGKTATSCKTIVPVKDEPELIAEIQKATAGGNWTANLNYIDTSKVTDMGYLFADNPKVGVGYDLEAFNGRIDKWNTSNVQSMKAMFQYATAFNQPIGNWDVSNVTNMKSMFSFAVAFNHPIGNWLTSNVTDMRYIFQGATKFNHPIGDWDVSKVTNMTSMFENATEFDQDLSKWTPAVNASSVTLMFDGSAMFTANNLATFAPWYCTTVGAGAGGGCP